MIKRDPITQEYLGIRCNKCETMAPPTAEIHASFGLNRMGWHCFNGVHLCPKHIPREKGTSYYTVLTIVFAMMVLGYFLASLVLR